jgi:hypothetical protein
MVPACRDNRPRSSTENHRKTTPDRLTEASLLGPIYGLTLSSIYGLTLSYVVQPVIIVPGWYVGSKGNYPVKAMNATYLVGYLKGARGMFSPEQLETTIRRLDEQCRVVEF